MTLKQFYSTHQSKLVSHINSNIKKIYETYPMETGKRGLLLLKDTVSQGKMIRGMLVLVSAHLHGCKITKEMYDVASAVEILHTAFLIHDDIIDDDYKRRNQDSVYYFYIKEGQAQHVADPNQYGMSLAMCLGDMIFFLAFDIISRNIQDPQLLSNIVRYISQETQHIGPAQMMDASFALVSDEPTEAEIDQVYMYKTAHYTFSLPLMLGAAFALQSNNSLLKSIGRELGVLFQLRDDELGIFGTSYTIGKAVGSDIRENKKTYMRHLLFSQINDEEKQELNKVFGKKELKKNDIEFVRNMFETHGISKKVHNKIQSHRKRLEGLMSELRDEGIDVSILQDLSSFVLTRET